MRKILAAVALTAMVGAPAVAMIMERPDIGPEAAKAAQNARVAVSPATAAVGDGQPVTAQNAVSNGKPTVFVTIDPAKASQEIVRLRETGWMNPNKIEYADDPVVSLLQFKYWLDKGYIDKDGSWSEKGMKEQGWMDTGYENGKAYKKYMGDQA
ncbi:hypothetical protein CDO52_05870 [Nocardiopsis gilva YIM 90087]|uniref:SH3 domain-containing protein n=1 Tax=Nocardiopsis gilva YIM 90087 TaxID=1235441 RepID=A0A223S2N1_9ACTN|nr:hypothetical protein [Nocardiopsis gilva]ASU82378.1 hypothetical protein CDO52_05870 [Nocardiopsis gilva YIM 90087]